MPVRVENGTVTVPGDGAAYPRDVERMFPDGLADRVLEHADELRP